MTEEPTQTGGTHPNLTGRAAAMAQISEKVDADHQVDLADFDEETGEITPRKTESAEQVLESAEPAAEAVEAAPTEEPPKKMHSLTVLGQTIEVEESRVLEAGKRTLQKESAADKKLQEATETLARAKQYEQSVRSKPAPEDPAPSADAPQEEEAPATGINPAQLDAYLENRLYMRDAKKAAAAFVKEFPEIANDEKLAAMAASLEDRRISEATALGESFGDPFEAYRNHGIEIREWLSKRVGVKTEAPVDKVERKRTITAVPATGARAPAIKEEVTPTTSQTIDAMRESRRGRLVKH